MRAQSSYVAPSHRAPAERPALPTHTVVALLSDGSVTYSGRVGSAHDMAMSVDILSSIEREGFEGATYSVRPLTAYEIASMYPNG